MLRILFGAAACIAIVAASGADRAAAAPGAYCRQIGTDDMLRPQPRSLAGITRDRFGLKLSDDEISRTSVYRCSSSHVLGCTFGANLNCGKADRRGVLPAADATVALNRGSPSSPWW